MGAAPQACAAPARTSPVTGLCLPRWVSLKSGEAVGRKGPDEAYPEQFVYHARGLPVQIVEETTEWRRICDPMGGAVWVNRALLSGRRNLMTAAGPPSPLRAAPQPSAAVLGRVSPRALAALETCRAGWCKVRVGGREGWLDAAAAWGVAEAPQCR